MSTEYNEVAERLLRERGFECEPEPNWVEGKVPDFLCTGSTEFWVEVKSLDEPDEFKVTAKGVGWLRDRATRVKNQGWARAMVSDDADERDVNVALRLADRALAQIADGRDQARHTYVVVPQDPEYGKFVRIEGQAEDGPETYHCVRSASGRYGRPATGPELVYDAPVFVTEQDGTRRQTTHDDLDLYDDKFRVALEIAVGDEPFRIKLASRSGMAFHLNNTQRFRGAASEANAQFKNACLFREAPCLLMVYQSDLYVADERMFVAAFYGDLTILWPRDGGELHQTFGDKGVWNEAKNTTTSAACYVRNNDALVLVHNYWAKNPLPVGLLGCVEHVPKDDGTFEVLGR